MKKDVLFNKLITGRRAILVFLLALITSFGAFAQTRQITGHVTSAEDGSGMAGVSVRIKGTNTGAITDINGAFRISASTGTVINFSYVGYQSQDLTIGDASNYNVKLSYDAKTLVEVNVVSVGYGTQKRTDLTGSISSVSAATIAKVPVYNFRPGPAGSCGRRSGYQ